MFLQGTLASRYPDPESFTSHRLTDKSDVCSFGAVLLELIAIKKARYAHNFNEKESLTYFYQKTHLITLEFEIIDEAVVVVLDREAGQARRALP